MVNGLNGLVSQVLGGVMSRHSPQMLEELRSLGFKYFKLIPSSNKYYNLEDNGESSLS